MTRLARFFLLLGTLCLATACGDDGPTGPDGGGGDPDGGGVVTDGGSTTPDGGVAADAGGSSVCPIVGFAACGGDVVGTWNVTELCPEDEDAFQALCESPFSDRPACVGAGNTQHCRFHREGSLDLTAGGTFDFPLTARIEASYTFDDACLTDLALVASGAPDAQCSELDAGPNLACSYAAGACSCTSVTDPEDQTTSGTYTVDGTQLSIDFGGKVSTGDYCVEGDVLTIDVMPHPVSWRYWVFRRE